MLACMHACMHASMYACMFACMQVCMYSYICVYRCIYVDMHMSICAYFYDTAVVLPPMSLGRTRAPGLPKRAPGLPKRAPWFLESPLSWRSPDLAVDDSRKLKRFIPQLCACVGCVKKLAAGDLGAICPIRSMATLQTSSPYVLKVVGVVQWPPYLSHK